MTNFRLMLLSTAAAGLVAAAVSPASAGEVTKTMSISGHINRAIVVANDGQNTTVSQIDNSNVSESRIRAVASAKSESMTISTTMELGVASNHAVSSQSAADNARIRIRHSFIKIANSMGSLSMGHTWTADWLSTSASLSGTGAAGFWDGNTPGGENIHVKNDTGTVAGPTVDSVLPNYVGYRANNIKYTTPNMNGFTAEVGFANQDHAAASLRYSGDFNGTKVTGTAAWGSRKSDAVKAAMGGSLAVALPSGLNGAVAYSKSHLSSITANAGRTDPKMWGASIGYTMGANGVTGWYQTNTDTTLNGDKGKIFALTVEHKMADYGTEVYGGIERVSYKTTATTTYDNLTAGWVGMRVKF